MAEHDADEVWGLLSPRQKRRIWRVFRHGRMNAFDPIYLRGMAMIDGWRDDEYCATELGRSIYAMLEMAVESWNSRQGYLGRFFDWATLGFHGSRLQHDPHPLRIGNTDGREWHDPAMVVTITAPMLHSGACATNAMAGGCGA